MSTAYNPSIVTNGLVLAYDAANVKSFDDRENLFLYSEDLTQAAWVPTESSVTTNAVVAPDGTLTADKIVDTALAAFHYISQTVSVLAATYTFSVYVKAGEIPSIGVYPAGGSAGAKYNVSTGALIANDAGITSTITSIGNGWYRISATYTYSTSGSVACRLYLMNPGTSFTGTGTSGIYIWGAQLEQGTVATNYIKTTASSNPRSTSVSDLSGNNNTGTVSSLSYANIDTFNFNGTSNYISDSTLSFTTVDNNTTILCWAWPDSTGPVNSYTGLVAFGGRASTTPSDSVLLCLNTSAATWYVGSAYWSNDYNPSNLPVIKDAWNMCGVVARSAATTNNTKLICGNSSGLSTVTGSSSSYTKGLTPTKVNLTVGCTDNGGSRFMKGRIGMVMIYNRELSDTEIRQNFLAIKSRYGL